MAFMVGMYHTRELYNKEVTEIINDRSADDWFDQIISNFVTMYGQAHKIPRQRLPLSKKTRSGEKSV